MRSSDALSSDLDWARLFLDVVPPDMTLYLFGSAVHGKATGSSDVDVLLVYNVGQHDRAHAVACALRETIAFPPLDVLAMSQSEEKETNFVAAEGAVMLYQAGSAHF